MLVAHDDVFHLTLAATFQFNNIMVSISRPLQKKIFTTQIAQILNFDLKENSVPFGGLHFSDTQYVYQQVLQLNLWVDL